MSRGRAARLIEDSPADVAIPDKLYFRIGEVSELTRTKAFVLRYWETEFASLRPVKGKSGHRLYRRKDVELIFQIRRLLYEKGRAGIWPAMPRILRRRPTCFNLPWM